MDYKFTVGFSRSKSCFKLGSTVIRAVEKRPYSHVYICYSCPFSNEQIVSQASHGFVNETEFNIFKQQNEVIKEYEITCDKNQFKNVINFSRKHLGVKYSQLQILWIGIKKILHIQVGDKNNDLEFICSEWGVRICEIAELEKAPENIDTFTPSDMDKLLTHLDEVNNRVNLITN